MWSINSKYTTGLLECGVIIKLVCIFEIERANKNRDVWYILLYNWTTESFRFYDEFDRRS